MILSIFVYSFQAQRYALIDRVLVIIETLKDNFNFSTSDAYNNGNDERCAYETFSDTSKGMCTINTYFNCKIN